MIVSLSVGLGFVNEYRAELASEALHSQLRHTSVVRRDSAWSSCDLTELVPGDVVRLEMGAVVPADVRLLSSIGLECDESMLTGESFPVAKDPAAVPVGAALDELASCALMGTIVHGGTADAVVTATGAQTEFGRIALQLGQRQEETEFQAGLRRFSLLLARVPLGRSLTGASHLPQYGPVSARTCSAGVDVDPVTPFPGSSGAVKDGVDPARTRTARDRSSPPPLGGSPRTLDSCPARTVDV